MTSTKSCIELSEYPRPASLSYQEDDSQYHTEPIAELPPNVFDSAPSSTSRARRPSNQLPAPDHDDIQLNPFSSRARRPSSSLFNSSRKSSEFLPEESEHPPSLSPSSSLPVPAALQERSQQQQLKPIDRGRTANLFLFAALVAELTVWGMPFSVGVLHEYWTNTLFKDQGGESLLTLAATLQTGLMYLGCMVCGPIHNRFPRHRFLLQGMGLAVASLSMVGSAFATKPWHVLVSIGFFYPFSCFFYLPAATLLFEWFHARRGIATGIMYAGTGLGGCIFPFVMQGLLSFGYKAAMIALALGFFIINAAVLPLMKSRIPPARKDAQANRHAEHHPPKFNASFLRRSTFYAFIGCILLTSCGNFIPSVWIPTYANDIDLHKPSGTALIAIMNAASVPGLLLFGYISDHFPLRLVITISCMGSAFSCLLVWGFASSSAPVLITFVLLFGLLALSFSAVWSKLISTIARDDPSLTVLLFSLISFARGIGNISSGPVASALLKSTAFQDAAGSYGVKNYGALLLYSGVTMAAGSLVGIAYKE